MPSFEGAAEWLNQPTNQAIAKGRPLLVHFWSMSSDGSTANIPHLAELRHRRKRDGLRLIAVHLPLRPEERDAQAVRAVATKLDLTEPCALDNFYAVRDEYFDNADDVPAYFLFDIEHRLKRSAAGENAFHIIEDELAQMLIKLRERHPFCPQCELF